MADASWDVAIYDIRADDIQLRDSEEALYLYFIRPDVRIALRTDHVHADWAAEAAAMRRLAEVATEAAGELERLAAQREGEQPSSAERTP